MGQNQALNLDDSFAIIEALHKEAELTLTADERARMDVTADVPEEVAEAPKRAVIQSRKPRTPSQNVPIFTRISDLYEEADATRLLAEETARDKANSAPEKIEPETISPENISPENTGDAPASLGADDKIIEDDFVIPAAFGVPEEDAAEDAPQNVTEDEIALLSEAIEADSALSEDTPSDDVTISDEIEPAVALDDVLEGLLPPEQTADQTADQTAEPEQAVATAPLSEEAQALAALDATRPEADEALTEQLEAVKSAVEQAHNTPQTEMDDAPKETAEDAPKEEDLSTLTAGPALATFIGETVREVLEEELPHRVRGLVDEALGERQGRYGRSETPHIGLRTKPSRH